MNRFYVDKEQIQGKWAEITGEDVKHITKVLRLKAGDSVILCDGDNRDYDGTITKTDKDRVNVRLERSVKSVAEANVELTLYQSIAKGAKMDFVIQKGTEIGVHCFVPVISHRTVVNIKSGRDIRAKQQRWQRIAMEAAKQSGRGRIPTVRAPVSFEEATIEMSGYNLAILTHGRAKDAPIASVLDRGKDYRSIAVMIGPEGGFSDEEAEKALDKGIDVVSIGLRTLRTETAGIVVASILMYKFGDLGGKV